MALAARDDLRRLPARPEVRRARVGQAGRRRSAIFGGERAVHLLSVNIWRTIHPLTTRRADAASRRCAGRSGSASLAFMLLFVVLLSCASTSSDSGRRSTSCISRKRTEMMRRLLIAGRRSCCWRRRAGVGAAAAGRRRASSCRSRPAAGRSAAGRAAADRRLRVRLARRDVLLWTIWRRLNKVETEMRALARRSCSAR